MALYITFVVSVFRRPQTQAKSILTLYHFADCVFVTRSVPDVCVSLCVCRVCNSNRFWVHRIAELKQSQNCAHLYHTIHNKGRQQLNKQNVQGFVCTKTYLGTTVFPESSARFHCDHTLHLVLHICVVTIKQTTQSVFLLIHN